MVKISIKLLILLKRISKSRYCITCSNNSTQEKKFQGGVWIVDSDLYSYVQDVALLKNGSEKKSCDTIWKLLSEKKIKQIIKNTGYYVY